MADPPLDAGGGATDAKLTEDDADGTTDLNQTSNGDQILENTELNKDEQCADDDAGIDNQTEALNSDVDHGETEQCHVDVDVDDDEIDATIPPTISSEKDEAEADHCDTETAATETESHQPSSGQTELESLENYSQASGAGTAEEASVSSINVVVTDIGDTDSSRTTDEQTIELSGSNGDSTVKAEGAESKGGDEIEPEMSSVDLSAEDSDASKEVSLPPDGNSRLCVDDSNINAGLSGHSSSASNSERSSMTASPAFEPVLVPAESLENRTTLENMAGDIQSVIDRSFAMLETDTPSATDSASDSGPCTPPSELSSDGLQPSGSSASNDTSSHSTPLHNRAVLDIQCDSNSSEHSPSHFQGVVSADASVVQLGHEEIISAVTATEVLDTKVSEKLQMTGTGSDSGVHSNSDPNLDENDRLLSELESELDSPDDAETFSVITLPNGLHQTVNLANVPEHKDLRRKYEALQKQLQEKQSHVQRLNEENKSVSARLSTAVRQRDDYHDKLEAQRDQTVEDIYLVQIKELENTIVKQNREIQQGKERLNSHDLAAKRAINTVQSELQSKVDQVTKMYREAQREKENMVMTYAQAEQKNIRLQGEMAKVDNRMKEMTKEREIFMNRFRNLKMEKQKISEVFDSKGAEMSSLRRELERYKELLGSLDTKVKWAQNKLKSELEAHKETKAKLEEATKRIKQSREETEQIRRDCQAIIKTYQTSEEIKSNSLDSKLKKKEVELLQEKQEKTDQEEVHLMVIRELENLKKKHKEMIDTDRIFRDKIQCLEAERMVHEETMKKLKETLQKQKRDNQDMHMRLQELDEVDQQLNKQVERADTLQERVAELEEESQDLTTDMQRCSSRESEHLDFTQKISDKNARLQSENTTLSKELTTVSSERNTLSSKCASLERRVKKLETELAEEQRVRKETEEGLTSKLQSKVKEVGELVIMLDDERSENKTLKRKNVANIKDLTRQLQQARKKLDGYEHTERDCTSLGSMGSRTSSNNSLDTITAQQQHQHHHQQQHQQMLQHHGSNSTQPRLQNQNIPTMESDVPFVEVVEVDKQMLMDKIVRLQKAHARKNEKMEFMEDHITQLSTEVKKKTKLIQHYVMMMDAGTVTPESHDLNKAQLVRKGGIMASLYSHHQQDGAMNLDLSLEINHKIQAVLEDTLLKNITLKENLDTLGQEIARLSQENRRLQLILQGDRS